MKWELFSEEEFTSAIAKYNNSSTPGLDKLSWRYLRRCVNDVVCLKKLIDIANTCIELDYWLQHFKVSMSIVISKPNKKLYNPPKAFQLIVLLNIIGKLIEKVIREKLQFQSISNEFIHQC